MHTEVFYQVGYEAQTFFDKVGLFRRERPGPIKVTKRSGRKYVKPKIRYELRNREGKRSQYGQLNLH